MSELILNPNETLRLHWVWPNAEDRRNSTMYLIQEGKEPVPFFKVFHFRCVFVLETDKFGKV